jgi:hypothetical protein
VPSRRAQGTGWPDPASSHGGNGDPTIPHGPLHRRQLAHLRRGRPRRAHGSPGPCAPGAGLGFHQERRHPHGSRAGGVRGRAEHDFPVDGGGSPGDGHVRGPRHPPSGCPPPRGDGGRGPPEPRASVHHRRSSHPAVQPEGGGSASRSDRQTAGPGAVEGGPSPVSPGSASPLEGPPHVEILARVRRGWLARNARRPFPGPHVVTPVGPTGPPAPPADRFRPRSPDPGGFRSHTGRDSARAWRSSPNPPGDA